MVFLYTTMNNNMNVLVYGSRGWIGQQFIEVVKRAGVAFVCGDARVDDMGAVEHEIASVSPTHVVSFIGRTHGKIGERQYTTIDYLEQEGRLTENVRDNLFSPVVLAMVCGRRNIHYTYLGTGCIFKYDEAHPMDPKGDAGAGFWESAKPNFFGSSYSVVKGYTDQLMSLFADKVLNLRIRMPITGEENPRNFVTKIATYEKVCSVPNSMTVLDELLPYALDLMRRGVTGALNFTNPGVISHNEMLEMYREIVDPEFTWQNFSQTEQRAILAADRSNNFLETSRLESLVPHVQDIKTSVRKALESYRRHRIVARAERAQATRLVQRVPVVIHHAGGCPAYYVNCVTINAQENDVILIGDEATREHWQRRRDAGRWCRVEHVMAGELESDASRALERSFENYSFNDAKFEMFCVLRAFYLNTLMEKRGLERVCYVDSDCVLLCDINAVLEKRPEWRSCLSVDRAANRDSKLHMVACIHNSVLTKEVCVGFVDFCLKVYDTKELKHLIEEKWEYHRTKAKCGGVCDMTLWYLYYKMQEERKARGVPFESIVALDEPFELDGELCVFDHNVSSEEGHLGKQTFLREEQFNIYTPVKKITKRADQAYVAETRADTGNGDKKHVRLLSVHYQGASKAGLDSDYHNMIRDDRTS